MFVRFSPWCRPGLISVTNVHIAQFRLNSGLNRKNFYTVLGVSPSSDAKEIKENFYKLSKEFHPDLNKDDEGSLTRFKEIAEAYEVLSNPEEKRTYDERYGFNKTSKSSPLRNRNFRRFNGMKGGFDQQGRFVDEEGPPEMRNIQYDLSPEKMERIWARYKERWDKVEEVQRERELEKKKKLFRQRIDERRANMKNMSPEEREDFLFKLRMLRTDASDFGTGRSTQEPATAAEENNKDDSSSSSWVGRENQRIQQNLDFRQQIRESVKARLAEEEKLAQETSKKQAEYMRNMHRDQSEQEETGGEEWEREFRQKKRTTTKSRLDEAMYTGMEEEKAQADERARREDPMMWGLNVDEPGSFNEYMKVSYERSKERMEEMKRSQPFTYHQQSVKHGIVKTTEVKANRGAVLGVFTIFVGLVCGELYWPDADPDKAPIN